MVDRRTLGRVLLIFAVVSVLLTGVGLAIERYQATHQGCMTVEGDVGMEVGFSVFPLGTTCLYETSPGRFLTERPPWTLTVFLASGIALTAAGALVLRGRPGLVRLSA